MTAIDDLRQDFLNVYLHRVDDPAGGASNKPWSDDECDRLIGDALTKLWPRLGRRITDDMTTDSLADVYIVPSAFYERYRISRIDLLDSRGFTVDRITNWRYAGDGELLIKPILAGGNTLRVWGWIPFADDATDLPTDLAETVAHRAASRAWSGLASELANSERQQNLDSGRVVSYQDAVGLAAFHERLYQEGTVEHPAQVSYAPRASQRR